MAEGDQVLVLLKADGGPSVDGEPSKPRKFNRLKPFSRVVEYLKKKLKDQVDSELFVYVNRFCPSLDEELGVLFEAYKIPWSSGEFCLMVHYAPRPMYG